MLIELAVGDAYGAGFEYAERAWVEQHNTLDRYVLHPRHNIAPGSYTDDTQMTLAIAEIMVSGVPWTKETLAEKFVEVFKRDPREGYAGSFYRFLSRVRDGTQFLREIRPDSDKSGAAMRAAPIGLYTTIDEVIEKATLQAELTHNTFDGVNAAVAAALMAHYFIYRLGPKQQLGRFLEQHVPGRWAERWRGPVKAKGWMSVRAAITALLDHSRMSDILQACIAFTGDVDTVATIALAAGSWSVEIKQDLPGQLVQNLEQGPYGREYLLQLDAQLTALKRA
uniref:ADP-ribosylglycohydrolase n=1 Tax=Thermosporothrix sp. COM3 TaxID=2490863 RepID=A0A455SI12_9CHLR|nr:hypothetical protein KTC_12930 [Thermosporothrix sp. COM3]